MNDIVNVFLKIGNTTPLLINCRISKLFYFYDEPIYEVVTQQDMEHIWYGCRIQVTNKQIKSKCK